MLILQQTPWLFQRITLRPHHALVVDGPVPPAPKAPNVPGSPNLDAGALFKV